MRRVAYRHVAAEAGPSRPFNDLVLLTTCNRVEAYAVTRTPELARGVLRCVFALPEGAASLYELDGLDAAIHLLRVASGLDSIALGESQIADQVRRAPEERPEAWRHGGTLAELFARAARLAPRVRRLASPDGEPTSASHAAVRYIRDVVRISNARVTLLGSGKMARLAAESLQGHARITIVNRHFLSAHEAARRLGARAAPRGELRKILAETDILIAATSSQKPLLGRSALTRATRARTGRPLWIIDLGVPRNVDPSAADLDGVNLITVDDLAPWSGSPLDPAARALAERRIRAEAESFLAHLRPPAADHVVMIRTAAEQLRRIEVRRALARMPSATEAERETLDKMADRLVNRLLHAPTVLVRRLQAEGNEAGIAELLEGWSPAGGRE